MIVCFMLVGMMSCSHADGLLMLALTLVLQDPREEVMTLERVLLQTIKFDLQVQKAIYWWY